MTRRSIVGVSLKAYFDGRRTLTWAGEVAVRAAAERWCEDVDVFVLPDFLGIAPVARVLAGTGVAIGAQDVSARGPGATTGDVPAVRLAEAGCTLAAVGHAERRRLHGETDAVVAAKVERLLDAALTPLVCIGEDRPGTTAAAEHCLRQVSAAIGSRADEAGRVVVAYEPVWAIGATEPAPADYVSEVVGTLRAAVPECRYLYGGSARPGLLAELGGADDGAVDGVFLGRFAHDPEALAAVVAEARALRAATNPS